MENANWNAEIEHMKALFDAGTLQPSPDLPEELLLLGYLRDSATSR
jgi:hypothetical protein